MTEDEAHQWVMDHLGPAVHDRLARFAGMVIEENERQNLISPNTVSIVWARHIVDSLQLAALGADRPGLWLDIGSGGGFPGLVLAIADRSPMWLVEQRKRRAEFLQRCVAELMLEEVEVFAGKVEQVRTSAAVISARAVATVENLLRAAAHCATDRTRWLLPRGAVDTVTLSDQLHHRRLVFHVEQSLTHPESMILVLDGAPA